MTRTEPTPKYLAEISYNRDREQHNLLEFEADLDLRVTAPNKGRPEIIECVVMKLVEGMESYEYVSHKVFSGSGDEDILAVKHWIGSVVEADAGRRGL